MPRPTACCLFCGRDTRNKSQICRDCTGESKYEPEGKPIYHQETGWDDAVQREVDDAMRDATE